jgi:hypothetical protein
MSERSLHHRKMKCHGGKKTPENMSNVPVKLHRAWHTLFKDRKPEDIAAYINAVWIDPDKIFVCLNRKDYKEGRYSW